MLTTHPEPALKKEIDDDHDGEFADEFQRESSWRRLNAASAAVRRSSEILDKLEKRRERRRSGNREVRHG